jgi:hypothetical protein
VNHTIPLFLRQFNTSETSFDWSSAIVSLLVDLLDATAQTIRMSSDFASSDSLFDDVSSLLASLNTAQRALLSISLIYILSLEEKF